MTELYLDDHALYAVAKGLQARQAVLDIGGTVETANTAYQDVSWIPYDPIFTVKVLEENPNLNESLIVVLEAKLEAIKIKKSRKREGLEAAIALFEELTQKYEVLRRMTAYDSKGVIVRPL